MELKGKVHLIGEVEVMSAKFQKRALVIEYAENPQYPEFIKFEAHQDKCDLLDELAVGDEVEVFFNLKGKPWTNKEGVTSYFNNMVVWKLTNFSATGSASGAATPEYAKPVDISSSADDDDLPF